MLLLVLLMLSKVECAGHASGRLLFRIMGQAFASKARSWIKI